MIVNGSGHSHCSLSSAAVYLSPLPLSSAKLPHDPPECSGDLMHPISTTFFPLTKFCLFSKAMCLPYHLKQRVPSVQCRGSFRVTSSPPDCKNLLPLGLCQPLCSLCSHLPPFGSGGLPEHLDPWHPTSWSPWPPWLFPGPQPSHLSKASSLAA